MRDSILINAPSLWLDSWPPLLPAHNKYDRGHVTVVGGPLEQTGAARLAAYAALRAGAGLVTVACDSVSLPVYAASLLAVMTRVADDEKAYDKLLADIRRNVFVLGPGMGESKRARRFTLRTLALKKTAVLDADALNLFALDPEKLFKHIAAPCVLTPHEGEFARLFATQLDMEKPRERRAREAARISGATVVLKGADTVIAGPDGAYVVNRDAPATLATAGSGDVLAGLIAGLLAQGMPAFEAACAGVWIHGEAAKRFGTGLISEDLLYLIPPVLADLL